MRKILKIIKKKPRFWASLLLAVVVFIAYGQTLRMYFWQDDSALIFKLQNPQGRAGSFGAGLWERGAYQYLVVPFVPFFKVFGLEPFGYFAIGFLTYLLATAAFYLFAQELLKSKKAGFAATLVFAAGYVGSDTMFRIINSWQTNIGLVLALLTFWIFARYLREGGIRRYLLSLGMFLATIELVFIRSHSLILPILGLDVLLRMIPPRSGKLPRFISSETNLFILRQLPFWFLWQQWYLKDASFGGPGLKSLLQEIIFQREIIKLSPFLANIGNGLVPNVLQTKIISFLLRFSAFGGDLDSQVFSISVLVFIISAFLAYLIWRNFSALKGAKVGIIILLFLGLILNLYFYDQNLLWYRDIQSVIAGLIGIQAIILILFASYFLWGRNKEYALGLVFGLLLLTSQFFGYYTQYPTSIFATTHRYFSHSFIGYSLLFGTAGYLILEAFTKRRGVLKFLGIAPLIFLIGTNLALGFRYQAGIVEQRSLPTRKFYQDLKRFVPSVAKGAAFYFDVINDGFYQRQFGDFFSVGSMPESTALAIYYGIDRYDVLFLTDFDELVFKLSSAEVDADNIHTFFYGPEGLVDTTSETRELLKEGSKFRSLISKKQSIVTEQTAGEAGVLGKNIQVVIPGSSIKPLSPILLKTKLKIAPLAKPKAFPYQHGKVSSRKFSLEEKKAMLGYLLGRKRYYEAVRASSLSDWKFREVRNVVDQDPDTVWQGHRIWWHDRRHEQLVLDLGMVKTVNRFVWQNWKPTLTPTTYSIEVSLDGKVWRKLKEVRGGPERKSGELVIEEFAPTQARFIRMDITATLTDDSPAILEAEVIEAKYSEVDPAQAQEFFENPFSFVQNQQEWNALYQFLAPIAQIRLGWSTDKKDIYNNSTAVPVKLDGQSHFYEVILPAGGTKLEDISFTLNFPAEVVLEEVRARNLSLSELEERGLVKEFEEN